MYLIFTASKDTYITNKIIDSSFRATDANVGYAGTIDLFKLYNESMINNVSGTAEISRGFVKFDYQPIKNLTGSVIDLNSSNFKAMFQLSNLVAGTATPSNFKLVVTPLSQAFREGVGRDLVAFSDLDTANFITASISDGTPWHGARTAGAPIIWHLSGSGKGGLLGSDNIDFITSGTIDGSLQSLASEQTFTIGTEDLFVDVTKIVSATLDGKIPDHGFRIAFTGSEEQDTKTRFVKRFASVQSSNPLKKPRLHIIFNDSSQDSGANFVFDHSGSLFLNNFVRGQRTNFVSGAAATSVSGESCMTLRLELNDWSKKITASQITRGTDSTAITGLYSASFAISTFDTTKVNSENETLLDFINSSGSITFTTIWSSTDSMVGYHTGSLKVKRSNSSDYVSSPNNLIFKVIALPSKMQHDEILKVAIFVEDRSREEKVYKVPYRVKSSILSSVYYRIRDLDTGLVVIPFEIANNGTKLSSDSQGMYFELRTQSLPRGRNYVLDLMVKDYGQEQIYLGVGQGFRVE